MCLAKHAGDVQSSPGERREPVRMGGSSLGNRPHVCAFFNNPDEEYRSLLPFIAEGLQFGEKGVHTIDPRRLDDHRQRLASAGVNVAALVKAGQLDLRDWYSTHLRSSKFDPQCTLAIFEEVVKTARLKGFPLIRFVTHMEWFLETDMEPDELLEYEAMTNELWLRPTGPLNPIICVYDLRRFRADVVVDVMRTHPLVIVGGVLQENPFFVSPDAFLRQLRARRAGSDLPPPEGRKST